MTTPGAIAQHEAEIALAHATAVRALMATGATHDEARAAVDEHLRHTLTVEVARREYQLARIGDALADACARFAPVLDATARAFAAIRAPRITQADVTLAPPVWRDTTPDNPGQWLRTDRPAPGERDRVRALLAAKRAGKGAGPRPPRMDGRRS